MKYRTIDISQPLGVDISNYSDEYCEGFIAGQRNVLDFLGLMSSTEAKLALIDSVYERNEFTETADALSRRLFGP